MINAAFVKIFLKAGSISATILKLIRVRPQNKSRQPSFPDLIGESFLERILDCPVKPVRDSIDFKRNNSPNYRITTFSIVAVPLLTVSEPCIVARPGFDRKSHS